MEDTALFLLTDPKIMGGLQWFGTAATLIGFFVAYLQLRKTKNAANAALDATATLGRIVQGREQLLELNGAIAHLDNAKNALSQGSKEGASIYIELTTASLIQALELLNDTPIERKQVKRSTVELKRLAEALAELPNDAGIDEFAPLVLIARNLADGLKTPAARLRYNYDNPR